MYKNGLNSNLGPSDLSNNNNMVCCLILTDVLSGLPEPPDDCQVTNETNDSLSVMCR